MAKPHCIEQDATEQAPLYGHVKGLVVRVTNYISRGAALANRVTLKQLLSRAGTIAKYWSLGKETQRLAPIFKPKPGRTRGVIYMITLILDRDRFNYLL